MGTVAATVLAMTLSVTPANGGALSPPQITINAGPGLQQDPHVDGNTAAYSQSFTDSAGVQSNEIRYYDFASGNDFAIPNTQPGGTTAMDLLSDVDQGRIVFTRITDHAGIMLFDVATGALTELAADPLKQRIGVALGGNTAAFIDFTSGNGDLKIFDLSTGTLSSITSDSDVDESPAVSPDGNTVTWTRCVGTANCDIHRVTRTGGVWVMSQVSSSLLTERSSDTNGSLVVFTRENLASPTGTDIVIMPIGGSAETVLEIPGDQLNPSIRGNVLAFETNGGPESDLFVVDLASNRLFQITNTPGIKETLNDITVLPTGEIRLVWEADTTTAPADANIFGATFSLPSADPVPPTCRNVTLEATRFHSPTRSVDGDVSFSPAMTFAIPAALPVVAGNAGNKKAYLTIELANKTIECEYRSRAHQSHPSTPSQLALASSYVLTSCEEVRQGCGRNGSGHDNDDDDAGHGGRHHAGSFTAGTIVTAVGAHLHIQNGDTTQPMTRVRLQLAEICGGGTSTTSSPLQAGNDLDGAQAAGCSSSGASLTPFVIAFAFLALMMRRPTAIRLVTRREQRKLSR